MDAILLLSIFLGMFINVSSQSAQTVAGCPSSVPRSQNLKVYSGQCLQFVPKETKWTSAKTDCKSRGGSLVMIKNARKQTFIYNALRGLHWRYNGLWIGASDIDKEGSWVWVDGTQLSYGNWNPGEGPTHHGFLFSSSSYEDCAVLRYSNGGRWQDYSCDSFFYRYSYICEYDLGTTSTTQTTMRTSVTTGPRSTSVIPSTTSPSTWKTDTSVILNTAGYPEATSSRHTTLRLQKNGSTATNILTTTKSDVTTMPSSRRSTTEELLTTMGEEAVTTSFTTGKSQSTGPTTLTPSRHTTVHRPTSRLTKRIPVTTVEPHATTRLSTFSKSHTTIYSKMKQSLQTNKKQSTTTMPLQVTKTSPTNHRSTSKQFTSMKLQKTSRLSTKLKPTPTSNPLNLQIMPNNDKTADLFSPTQTVKALKPNTSVHPKASTNNTRHNQFDASNGVPNQTSDKTGKTGLIVGLVIGMLALLAVLVFGGIFVRRRRINNRTPKLDTFVHENKLYDVTCGTESTT